MNAAKYNAKKTSRRRVQSQTHPTARRAPHLTDVLGLLTWHGRDLPVSCVRVRAANPVARPRSHCPPRHPPSHESPLLSRSPTGPAGLDNYVSNPGLGPCGLHFRPAWDPARCRARLPPLSSLSHSKFSSSSSEREHDEQRRRVRSTHHDLLAGW